jgi:hypothetical protein
MATLYVDDVFGNDAATKAQVIAGGGAVSWKTIGRSAWGSTNRAAPSSGEAAAAGDTTLIAAGTYDYAGTISDRWDAVYNPVNAGTLGNPITFQAPSGPVILTGAAAEAPAIGSDGRDYITWTGNFSIDEATWLCTPDTGPVVLHGCTGSVTYGFTIDGNGGTWTGDNHNGVRIEGCESCTIANHTIHDVQWSGGPGNHNAAGIMLYDSHNTIIEHNWIYNCACPVFIKGVQLTTDPNEGTICRFNLFQDCTSQGLVVSMSRNGRYYQNLIINCVENLVVFGFGAAAFEHPDGDWIFNNTTVGGTNANVSVLGEIFCTGVRLWNNVHYNSGGGSIALYVEGATLADETRVSCEHNDYFGYTTFNQDSAGSHTFAAYLADYPDQDDDAVASITDDPEFVNAASDWHLGAGSPARDIGYAIAGIGGADGTLIPAGAYITGDEVIGPEDSVPMTTVPQFSIPSPGTSGALTLTSVTLNASGDRLAFVIQCPKAGVLDQFEFRTAAVSNNPDNGIRLSFQTINLANGDPDGTQSQFRDITGALAANTWQVPGLMTSDGTDTGVKRTVVAGELLGCVVDFVTFVASDSFAISALLQTPQYRNLYVDDGSAGSYTKSPTLTPLLALKYADGTYAEFTAQIWPVMAVTDTSFNSGSTPDERALRFQLATAMRAVGVFVTGDFDNAVDLVLYDAADVVLDTISFDPENRLAANKGYIFAYFPAGPHTLTATTTYRLAVKPTSGSSITTGQLDLPSATYQQCIPGGAEWYLSTRTNAGAWTDTTTSRPEIGLIFDGVETGSAPAGGGPVQLVNTGGLVN